MSRMIERAYRRACADVPCKPECQESWCVCDEQTRDRRSERFTERLKEAIRDLEAETDELKERCAYYKDELDYMERSIEEEMGV